MGEEGERETETCGHLEAAAAPAHHAQCICTYVYLCMYIYVPAYIYVYTNIYVHMYVFMYACTRIHTWETGNQDLRTLGLASRSATWSLKAESSC